MASNWYRLMRTVGRYSGDVNRNGLPGLSRRPEGVPVVTIVSLVIGHWLLAIGY